MSLILPHDFPRAFALFLRPVGRRIKRGQLLQASALFQPGNYQVPCAGCLRVDFAVSSLGAAAWTVEQALGAASDRADIRELVQPAIAAPAAVLDPDTRFLGLGYERSVECRNDMDFWEDLRNRLDSCSATKGEDHLVPVNQFSELVYEFVHTLAVERDLMHFQISPLFLRIHAQRRRKKGDLLFPA